MIRRIDVLAVVALLVAGCAKQKEPEPPPPPRAVTRAHPAILAPHRGEVLLEGQSYTIRWQTPGWDRVNVAAVMGGKDRGHLAFGREARSDSLVWEIPPGWVTGFGISQSDSVRLRIENAADPAQFVDSEPFTVKGDVP